MAHVSPFEFARAVQSVCDQSDLVSAYDVQILDDTVVKVQVTLTYDAFIDVFYNADTGKCSYALIEKAARVFGADNAFIGWHVHPSQHVPSPEISFLDFLKTVQDHVTRKQE